MTVKRSTLQRIAEATQAREAAAANGNGESSGSTRHVTPEVLAATREDYPTCQCEELDPGLRAGMLVSELILLEEGCTGSRQRAWLSGSAPSHSTPPGWVCQRLDKVRRIYGK